jgi:hypothetical protein
MTVETAPQTFRDAVRDAWYTLDEDKSGELPVEQFLPLVDRIKAQVSTQRMILISDDAMKEAEKLIEQNQGNLTISRKEFEEFFETFTGIALETVITPISSPIPETKVFSSILATSTPLPNRLKRTFSDNEPTYANEPSFGDEQQQQQQPTKTNGNGNDNSPRYARRIHELESQIEYYESHAVRTEKELSELRTEVSNYKRSLHGLQAAESRKDQHIKSMEQELSQIRSKTVPESTIAPESDWVAAVEIQKLQTKISELEHENARFARSLMRVTAERNRLSQQLVDFKLEAQKQVAHQLSLINHALSILRSTQRKMFVQFTMGELKLPMGYTVSVRSSLIMIVSYILSYLMYQWSYTGPAIEYTYGDALPTGNWWDGTLLASSMDSLNHWILNVVDPWIQERYGYKSAIGIS